MLLHVLLDIIIVATTVRVLELYRLNGRTRNRIDY